MDSASLIGKHLEMLAYDAYNRRYAGYMNMVRWESLQPTEREAWKGVVLDLADSFLRILAEAEKQKVRQEDNTNG